MNQVMETSRIKPVRTEMTRFMMAYKFALDELNTKIDILRQEFHYIHNHNPIEHVSSRLKSPESLLRKMCRKNLPMTMDAVRQNIRDIAGLRITCSFLSDIYVLADMLEKQNDLTVIERKDYIRKPKPNGYKSLHLIVQVPIFLSDRVEYPYVEIQIRTIAMDFWASLEHKIYYKYEKTIPEKLSRELKEAAETVAELDRKMERIHREIRELKRSKDAHAESAIGHAPDILVERDGYPMPYDMLSHLLETEVDLEAAFRQEEDA